MEWNRYLLIVLTNNPLFYISFHGLFACENGHIDTPRDLHSARNQSWNYLSVQKLLVRELNNLFLL